MAIVPKFKQEDIKKRLLEQRGKIEQAIITKLAFAGEGFIRDARSTNTYKDQTGNLRSSIGFVIIKEGVQMLEMFEGDKTEGVAAGRAVAADAAEKFPTGIVLIVVAGMGYAAAVESKGRDVITGSSYKAIDTLIEVLGNLRKKLT